MKKLNESAFIFNFILPALLGCIIACAVIFGGVVLLKLFSFVWCQLSVYYDLIFGI